MLGPGASRPGPFLGASTGWLMYLGVVGGFLIVTTANLDSADFSPEGITFLATLGGLFAKDLPRATPRRI